MRWWRREGVGGPSAVGWLGLLFGVLALAGCASSSINVADANASVARMGAEHGDRGGVTPVVAVQAPPSPSEPARGSAASGSRGPISALLSGLLGPTPHMSSAIDEEALIARAIAEHEMRNP
jgi:hypothetical protein